MSKGHVFLAQNSSVDYVTQAYALARTIKHYNKQYNQTCLITSDTVPDEYRGAFDYIVSIPGNDDAKDSQWKIHNRWKIIHTTPFTENLVYDTDMLLLGSNDHWWDFLSNKDVVLTSKVKDYKGRFIHSDFYRKTFTANSLPNCYLGVHYFQKTNRAYEFYKWLEVITKNYQEFYDTFASKNKQKFCSMDLNAGLAIKFMNAEQEFLIDTETPSFIHMKPAIQGWISNHKSWQDVISYSYDGTLTLANIPQLGVFHYTEDDFLTEQILEKIDGLSY